MMGETQEFVFFLYKQITLIRAFVGMTTMCEIMAKMSRGNVSAQDPISKVITDKFRTV